MPQRTQITRRQRILLEPFGHALYRLPQRKFERGSVQIHPFEPRFFEQASNAADIQVVGREGSPQMAVQRILCSSSERLRQRSLQIGEKSHQRSVMLVK